MSDNDVNKTLIFAHRGANKQAAENTRAAFDKALLYPVDGIETDVQLSKDNITVLWHDRYTDKLGYPNKRIDDFNFSELTTMNFAAFFGPDGPAEAVLSLKEFISTYRGRCKLQIEVKNRAWETSERHQIKVKQILDILVTSNNLDVFISSFNLQSMVHANQLNSQIPLFYSFDTSCHLTEVEEVLTEHAFLAGLCLPIQILNDAIMQSLRARRKKVLTYTCNHQTDIHKALDLGVDVLITDEIQKALAMREKCSGNFPV